MDNQCYENWMVARLSSQRIDSQRICSNRLISVSMQAYAGQAIDIVLLQGTVYPAVNTLYCRDIDPMVLLFTT
jgi:hypothetical protein